MARVFRAFLRRLNWDQMGWISYAQDPFEVSVGDVAAQSGHAVATLITKTVTYPCEVIGLVVKVTTQGTVTSAVFALTKTPLGGAESAAQATVTVPITDAVGVIRFNDLVANGKNFQANIGDVIKAKCTTADTGALNVNIWFVIRRSSQVAPTNANYIATAS